jgi:4-amino-4-deoxy-L-arabinose transferase-like glycosyltransferase
VTRGRAYALVAAACALPRLAVALHERNALVTSFTEKSLDFAQTFVASGTFGFVPHVPSASTQPLYGFFLIPIVWLFGASWLAIAVAQVGVALGTALLVYKTGRRVTGRRGPLIAALLATSQPYLVWHDVHVNREILDQLLGAAIVLLALLAHARRSLPLAVALGAVTGLAILSNTRLVALPIVLAAYLLWARLGAIAAVALLAAAALVVTPWVVRNRVQVGCFALTTDAKALWKANNPATYSTLAHGGWIDDVPNPPGSPPTPEMAGAFWRIRYERVAVDECAQMRSYEHKVISFWRHHPGEKAKLMGQATVMLWNPAVRSNEGGPSAGGTIGAVRRVVEPFYMVPLYALALGGLFLVGRPFRVLALALIGYETLAAWVFAGTTRYRVSWDFVLALLAAAAAERLLARVLPPSRLAARDRPVVE